jgi:hypothetical protein
VFFCWCIVVVWVCGWWFCLFLVLFLCEFCFVDWWLFCIGLVVVD